jgi:hypothetical protein
MPIRLNLLAEAHAAEDARRRDPTKRAILFGGCAVAAMLLWALSLYAKGLVDKSDLGRMETDLQSRTNEYQRVLANQRQLAETRQRYFALQQLATNRYLNGNILQALQQANVEAVQIVRLKTEQTYLLTPETKARTNAAGKVIAPAKPAKVTERILLTLDGKDTSATPGDQVTKFKDAIANAPGIRVLLGKTNEVTLRNLSPPQLDPVAGRPCVLFTLECRFPEINR